MQPDRKLQATVVVISLLLVALIFYFGRNNPSALAPQQEGEGELDETQELSVSDPTGGESEYDFFTSRVKDKKSDLTTARQEMLDSLDKQLISGTIDSSEYLKHKGRIWDEAKYRVPAGYYFKLLAKLDPQEEYWQKAGDQFFRAQKVASDTAEFNLLVRHTISAFENVLEINPENLNAKSDLAVAYFESEKDPEKGIGLLREVEATDPENEKALYYLGMINLRSGQYEQARSRLEKLVEIQPDNAFNHYYLGQIYLNLEKNRDALESFRKYRERVQDPSLQRQADEQIRQLEETI